MPSRCYKCLRPIEGSSFEGLHPECFASWFGLKKPEPFSYIAKESPAPDSDMLKFFHGKFPKYSALLGGKHYLMKFGTDEVPELCCAEYLCNQIARHIGLDVPDYFLIKYRN